MKVILLQTDICWADPAANVAYMDKLISAHAQDTDLFVLPEMFSTGFCTSPEGIAESSDSATLQWMKQKAAERNCAIAGSISVEENGKFYNRFYFVHPDGNVQWYNKKHLFTYGGCSFCFLYILFFHMFHSFICHKLISTKQLLSAHLP